MMDIIKPEDIKQLFLDEFEIDISEGGRYNSDMRGVYYVLCNKYCLGSTKNQIGDVVSRDHATVSHMGRRITDRINTGLKCYENLNYIYSLIEHRIKEKFDLKLEFEIVEKIDEYTELRYKKLNKMFYSLKSHLISVKNSRDFWRKKYEDLNNQLKSA